MVVGPSLILMNKYILSDIGFPYPVILSSLGLITTTLCTHLAYNTGKLALPKEHIVTLDFFLKKVCPIGALHAATIAFGNAQYVYIGVAVIQFLKAFTPASIAILGYLLLGKKLNTYAAMWLAALIISTTLSVEGDATITSLGLVLAALCSTCDAVRLVLQQYLLHDCKFGLWESMYFFAPVGGTFLFLSGCYLEGAEIVEKQAYMAVVYHPLSFVMVGFGGLGVVALNTSVIKVTSAVTLKALAIVRNGSVVVVGLILYREYLSLIQITAYLGSIFFLRDVPEVPVYGTCICTSSTRPKYFYSAGEKNGRGCRKKIDVDYNLIRTKLYIVT